MSTEAIDHTHALKTGLFAARDFICEGEEDEYDETRKALMDSLNPSGPLEELFAVEIVGATWRLRRCRLIEANLALLPNPDDVEKPQKAVDRARAQSHNLIRRSMAELRKLQTERQIRLSLELEDKGGLDDTRQVLAALAMDEKRLKIPRVPPPPAQKDSSFCKPEESSFCKKPANLPARLRQKIAMAFLAPLRLGEILTHPAVSDTLKL